MSIKNIVEIKNKHVQELMKPIKEKMDIHPRYQKLKYKQA